MNWLLVAVMLLLIFYTWRGQKRGFIRTVFTIFSTIIAIVITMWVSPYISKGIKSNDSLMTHVSEKVSEALASEADEEIGDKTTDEVEYIENLKIPSLLKKNLIENKTSDVYDAMAVDDFKGYVNNLLSVLLINMGTFIFVLLLAKVLLHITSVTLDLISNLPVISGLNRFMGLIAGLIHGVIVIWIGFVVITLFANYEFGQILFAQINESEILSAIYNNNIILVFLTDISKILF